MNQVEVCNLALGRIGNGASRPIQQLTEGSEPANACLRVFAPAMAAMLRQYDWPFARRSVALSLSTETVDGWSYAYAHPDNALYVLAVAEAGQDATRLPGKACRRPFGLIAAANGESLLIVSNVPQARAWYTVNVTNPDFADALFQDALAWRIAAELALGLKADPAMSQNAGRQYTFIVSQALAATGNETDAQGEEWRLDAADIRARDAGASASDPNGWGRW